MVHNEVFLYNKLKFCGDTRRAKEKFGFEMMRAQLVNMEVDEENRIEDRRFEGNSYNDEERALILGTWKVPSVGLPTIDMFL